MATTIFLKVLEILFVCIRDDQRNFLGIKNKLILLLIYCNLSIKTDIKMQLSSSIAVSYIKFKMDFSKCIAFKTYISTIVVCILIVSS